MILRDTALCVLDNQALTSLSTKASHRLSLAFRPKTYKAYEAMFRTFVAFCIVTKCIIANVNVKVILSFLECLVLSSCSMGMVANYVSAIRASFVMYDLPYYVLDHPKIKYFLKSLRINRPVIVTPHNIITISRLVDISLACDLPSCISNFFFAGFLCLFKIVKFGPTCCGRF